MRKILCIVIICPFLFLAQSGKKYPTLLWKITGKGIKKPSYLYGTMHVSNRVAYHLSEQFFEALKSVDVVGLETNPGEWLSNMDKTGELSQLNQFSNPYAYGKDFYKSTFDASFPEKRLLQGVLSYDPDIINGLLYRHNRSKENFEENTYIDLFIFQTASKLNKQLISLEDFVQSEIKARLSSLPDEETNDEHGKYKDVYSSAQKIEDAYRDGNLDALDSLSKLTSSKNTQKFLIVDRNNFFVNTIDSVLKVNRSIFSGVGAAHLPGQDGVIELLRKKGYIVEPVKPKNSKKSDQVRDELEMQFKQVNFSKQFITDSLFSVSVPGNLSQIVNLENVKYYINADMVNGSFYTIVRMKYLGPLFNVSPNQMMQKMDSLLFEYIPGKIISKKEITSNTGLKGIDLINKTRRGDEQHYQIYFTDLELILFKLGGKLQYASGTEAKQFFNSIQFQNKNENIVEFAPKTKGFSIKLPANYSYVKNNGSSVKGLVEDVYAYQKSTKQFFGLKHAVYSDFGYLEEDTFELNLFAKNILKNYNYTESVNRRLTVDKGLPCIKFDAKNKWGGNFYGKLIIKGIHYYLVYFISEKENVINSEDYFKSFTLSDFVSVNPTKEISDDDFYFKAKDEVTDNSLSRFNETFAKEYEIIKSKKEKDKNKNGFDYQYKSSTKAYYSPSSNEYVNIAYEKYNDYDYRTLKEIEDVLIRNATNNNSLNPTKIRKTNKDGLYTFQTTLKDTATSRAIELKMLLKNGIRYEISVPYDTTIGLKSWAKEFFETFTLKDTLIGKNILENKFEKLLNDMCSSDTLIRKQANTSLQVSVGMQKAFTDEFIKFLNDKKLSLINEESRAQLFVNGGTVESERIIEPYKKLYKQYTDSFYLQLCLLKGLAYLKTQNSYNTFYNLLMSEVPLVGAENVVNDVFSALLDSMELCKNFYPGILSLTKYDEYKTSVYSLMANMINKGVISSALYNLQKENIYADANLALKRYNPNPKTQQSDYGELDKVSKELAETIQANLDGLSNNNVFKGSGYLRSIETSNRHELINYAIILAPFYKTDEKVKQFFSKLNKIKAQSIAMPLLITLIKQDVTLNDTLLDYYCKNKYSRAFFYSELEKEKLTDKFSKKYLSQQSLIESVINGQKQLANLYHYEKDKKQKDTLIFIKYVSAKNKYQTGKLYIYKTQKTKFEEQQWIMAFVNNTKKDINSQIEMVSLNYFIDKNKTEQENMNDVLDEFYLSYRKRAIPSGTNGAYSDASD